VLRHVFVAGLALVLLSCAELPVPSSDVRVAGPTKSIPGASAFCAELPDECRFDPSEPERIVLTPEIFALIERVNLAVNREIEPVSDASHWGVADQWNYPNDERGDCEDFQLEKRRRLVVAGLPRRALLMTVVLNGDEGHAVLTVRTNQGDYILDNLSPAVLGWQETDYWYVKREDGAGGWVTLDGRSAMR
jgi:predicted transglutaminase-like cysteine proteinase